MSAQDVEQRDLGRVGLAVFVVALALTGTMVWMGIADVQWPKWLLALTTLL